MDTGSKIREQKKTPGESWGELHSGLFFTCHTFVSKVADGLGSGVRQPGARPILTLGKQFRVRRSRP